MRNVLIVLFMIISLAQGRSAGMEFFHGTWEEALAEAARQDKLIFVDAYTTWCGPCKRMAAEVFPDPQVGEFFNTNFICVKLDMEKVESETFRSKHRVSAYPTLLFINGRNEAVHTVRGAMQPDQLIQNGKQALAKADPAEAYIQAYESGDRSPELVYKYTRALIRASQPHLKVANDYVRAQTDLNTPDNLRYLLLTATEADSRLFELLVEHKNAVVKQEGADAFKTQVWTACRATAAKAKSFQNHDLLAQTWGIMKNHYPEKAEVFELETEMDYCAEYNDARGFGKAARSYARSVVANSPDGLLKLAERTMMRFGGDARSTEMAAEFARQATEKGEGYRYFYSYASILNQQGKKEDALKAANRAMEIAQRANDGMGIRIVQVLIRNIEGQ